jgi:hypothetical protein
MRNWLAEDALLQGNNPPTNRAIIDAYLLTLEQICRRFVADHKSRQNREASWNPGED